MVACLLRALRLAGDQRRVATCAACYAAIYADDDYCLYEGEIHHRSCVRYVRGQPR